MAVARFDGYFTLGFASISGSFAPVGSATTHNWRAFRITNATDGDMIFSFDGVTNNIFVPAETFVLYDVAANCDSNSNFDSIVMSIGTQFYVKQSTAPTTGAVYVEGFYARGQ